MRERNGRKNYEIKRVETFSFVEVRFSEGVIEKKWEYGGGFMERLKIHNVEVGMGEGVKKMV